MQDEEIKLQLLSSSPEFRRLFEEHHQFEGKLHALQTQHFLSDQEQVEEITLKKRKLQLKDEMNSLIRNFRSELSHQHS